MLKDGEIIERGKFNELLDEKGVFYDLYMSQFRRQEPASPPAAGNGLNPALLPAAAGA